AAPAGSAIQAPPMRRTGATVDLDVRRYQRGIGCGTIVLAILGGLSLIYSLSGTVIVAKEGVVWPLLVLLVVLLIVGTISAQRAYHRPQPPAGTLGVGRFILDALAILGIVGICFVLLAFAAFIVLFFVCLSSLQHGGFH